MARQPATRLHVSGYRFLLRRIECALLGRDIRAADEPIRAPAQSLMAGLLLAIVVLAGCVAAAVLWPQPPLGNAPIVMGKQSGALYVRVGETLHPVLNLASARLITKTNANPQPTPESELSHSKRGPLLGIPGAPQFLAEPLAEDESRWAVCDSDDGTSPSTTVVVGRAEGPFSHRLATGQTVLVKSESGGLTYLLYDGHRAVVNLGEPAVVRALRLDGRVPLTVSPVLLNAVPEAPPIAAPLAELPVATFPDRVPASSDAGAATLCVSWAHEASGRVEISLLAGGLPVPSGQQPVTLSQADGKGVAVDAVYLPPGRNAYVHSTSLSGDNARAGTRYLIIDTGVRFAIHDDDAAHDLGLPNTAIPAPWPILAALPSGPELSREKALVARDTVAAGTTALRLSPNSP
jgi:hypothetical protein